jgi:DNA-binding PadR family transcriptional regulator
MGPAYVFEAVPQIGRGRARARDSSSSYNLTSAGTSHTLSIYRDRIVKRTERVMAAAAWRAGEADSGLSEMFRCAGDLLGQLRRGAPAMSGGHWRGGPWERKGGGRKGPGHWGGGFGGSWGWPGPAGPPGAARGPKAGRGDVRAAILALLQEGPRNGYQIMSEIEERSGGAWRPSPGAVYPALSQLADEGLIAGDESEGKRTYRLTEAGREYVQNNPDRARGAWESVTQQEAWQVPGLFAEAARLGGGIVQMAHAGTPEQVQAAERLLEQTRRELYRILADDAGGTARDEQEI